MDSLTKRQEKILEALINEYVKTAEPVSSKLLAKKREFDICPATIRNELQELTDKGYIYQPHTSAGRAPTTKAYRFFVDRVFNIEHDLSFETFFDMFNEIEERTRDEFKYIEEVSKNLASETSNLILTYLEGRDFVLKEGWEDILQNPEFLEKSFLDKFIQEVEYLEKNIKKIAAESNSEINVYIGNENPIMKSDGFSLIVTKGVFPNNEKGVVVMLGPSRTGYERNISLLKSLIKSLE
ncbi:MAG: hypothetical protein WC845_02790 [Candidatus Staskawiczbacteria bacterium]|jgi:heat-inducible transcriptional repressor